jgi:hypothetical protein
MKKVLGVLLAIVLVTAVLVPTADAWRGGGHHGGGFRGGHGCFGCGFGLGFFSGAVLAGPYYNSPYNSPYYSPPYPYYGAPPAYAAPEPSCYTQPGYWQQVPMSSSGGFTTYQNVWVPQQSVCR